MSKKLSSDEILKLYQLAVDLADKTSSRRLLANSFFLTLQGVLLTGTGLFIKSQNEINDTGYVSIVIFAVLGIILCIAWLLTIKSYRDLNTAKFGVILKIEQDLPIKLFTDEWSLLETDEYIEWKKKIKETKSPRKAFVWLRERKGFYTPQSSVEKYIPVTITIAYAVMLIIGVWGLLR